MKLNKTVSVFCQSFRIYVFKRLISNTEVWAFVRSNFFNNGKDRLLPIQSTATMNKKISRTYDVLWEHLLDSVSGTFSTFSSSFLRFRWRQSVPFKLQAFAKRGEAVSLEKGQHISGSRLP